MKLFLPLFFPLKQIDPYRPRICHFRNHVTNRFLNVFKNQHVLEMELLVNITEFYAFYIEAKCFRNHYSEFEIDKMILSNMPRITTRAIQYGQM